MTPEMLARLVAPFPEEAVGKKPVITCPACRDSKTKACDKHPKAKCRRCGNYITPKHDHLDFVGHAYVTERLNQVDPEWGWEPVAFDERGLPAFTTDGCLWIRLVIGGKARLGVGDAQGKRGGDALKEAIGDAIRNAAMRFGVALEYWKKDRAATPAEEPPARTQPEPPPAAVPEQTEEQVRAGLRKKIVEIHTRRGVREIHKMADDFKHWSEGAEIGQASTEELRRYIEALAKEAS